LYKEWVYCTQSGYIVQRLGILYKEWVYCTKSGQVIPRMLQQAKCYKHVIGFVTIASIRIVSQANGPNRKIIETY